MNGTRAASDCSLRVLVIGQSETSVSVLLAEMPDVQVEECPGLQQALQSAAQPDVIVLLQDHPEQATPRLVRELLNAFPLSRLIVSCGPWCISDGRTRQSWPAASRVPSDMLCVRLKRELNVARGLEFPLPLTADRDECWEFDVAGVPDSVCQPLTIAVSTPDAAVAAWLDDAVAAAGHHLACDTEVKADVLLFDVDPWSARMAEALASTAHCRQELPIIALVGFNWAVDWNALRKAGVQSVLAKLAPLSELSRVLRAAVDRPRAERPSLQIVTDA